MKIRGFLLASLLFAAACGSRAGAVASYPVRVEGMTCGACAETVEKAVSQLPWVEKVVVSHQEGLVRVSYDPYEMSTREVEEAVRKAVEGAGYKVVPSGPQPKQGA